LAGGDRNFGYIAADESTNSAAIIDPSYSPKVIADFAREKGYNLEYFTKKRMALLSGRYKVKCYYTNTEETSDL